MVCDYDRSSHFMVEMKQISNKDAFTVAQAVEQTWLSRYPWPKKITYDKGSEFMAEFATMRPCFEIRMYIYTRNNQPYIKTLQRLQRIMANLRREKNYITTQ